MKTNTKEQILKLLEDGNDLSPAQIAQAIGISPQAVHRHLRKLVENNKIVKIGSAPRVFYKLKQIKKTIDLSSLTQEEKDIIEDNFSEQLATGTLVVGLEAFALWLIRIKQEKSYKKLAERYVEQRSIADKFKNEVGLIDLSPKVKATFDNYYLDGVYCQDFYSLPQFGKTYLGNLVTAGKSGQDIQSIKEIVKIFVPAVGNLIKDKAIDVVAWAPHSIPRKLMFLKELRKRSSLSLPEVKLVKAYQGRVQVAQKSLSKLEDRILNARDTIFIDGNLNLKNQRILVIDDALGSGATINETAAKLKKQLKADQVFGVAVVGSYKGFDVVSVV